MEHEPFWSVSTWKDCDLLLSWLLGNVDLKKTTQKTKAKVALHSKIPAQNVCQVHSYIFWCQKMESKGQCKRCSYESWRLLPLLGGYICMHHRVFEYFSLVHIKKLKNACSFSKPSVILTYPRRDACFFTRGIQTLHPPGGGLPRKKTHLTPLAAHLTPHHFCKSCGWLRWPADFLRKALSLETTATPWGFFVPVTRHKKAKVPGEFKGEFWGFMLRNCFVEQLDVAIVLARCRLEQSLKLLSASWRHCFFFGGVFGHSTAVAISKCH